MVAPVGGVRSVQVAVYSAGINDIHINVNRFLPVRDMVNHTALRYCNM